MVNIVSLSSLRQNDDEDEQRQPNQYYAGGMGNRGGGSGLSVIGPDGQLSDHIANIIARAQASSGNGETTSNAQPRHVITFYRDGFTVNDGPYRLRDDPSNRPFLEAIERG